jgi:hypothetical protein
MSTPGGGGVGWTQKLAEYEALRAWIRTVNLSNPGRPRWHFAWNRICTLNWLGPTRIAGSNPADPTIFDGLDTLQPIANSSFRFLILNTDLFLDLSGQPSVGYSEDDNNDE